MWKCPVTHCDGWVVHVNPDEKYMDGRLQWVYGECGSFWRKKQNMINEVLNIVGTFPYRSVYYEIKDKEVKPSEVTSFPGDSDIKT